MLSFLLSPIWGTINQPTPLNNLGGLQGGPVKLMTIILQTLIMAGGIYALFNFALAGYSFISAGSDSKKIISAWAKIWQTIIGVLFMAGSVMLAAIIGKLVFGSWDFILKPTIPGV
jgi:hypothetical protein